jgi:hypothetical protein
MQGEDSQSWISQRKMKTKVEAFGNLKFFQVQEESAAAQEGATSVIRSAENI